MFPQLVHPNSVKKSSIGSARKNINANGSPAVDVDKSNESLTSEANTLTKRKNFQDEVPNEKRQSAPNKEIHETQNSESSIKAKLAYLDVYRNVLKSEGTIWMIGYVLIYKLGEQGIIAILPMLLLDQGVSSSDTAMLTGVVCQCCSILGSLLGGLLSSPW